jgi:hypothetical protein
MKTSNKILLIAMLSIFAMIMLVGIGIRVYKPVANKIEIIELDTKDMSATENIVTHTKVAPKVNKQSVPANDKTSAINVTSKKVAVRDFNSLVVKGSWDVKIKRGDQYEVKLNIPAAWMNKVQVAKNEKTLYLLMDKDHFERLHLSAEITMPTLKKIKSVGGNAIVFSGINTPTLILETAGASDIQGKDNQIGDLWIMTLGATEITLDKSTVGNVGIKTSGASQVDLDNSAVTNAKVDLQGTSEVRLNMRGGKLSGQVAGMSSIIYRGKVSEQTIKTAGMSNVERR